MLGFTPKIKKEIIHLLRKQVGNNFLLIAFGSLARRQEKRSSDIDLALYIANPLSPVTIVEIREELNTKIHTLKDIDVIDLADGGIDSNLLGNILKEGIIWHKPKNSKELLESLKRRLINTEK